ncbi:hypothetical protein GW17_00011204 [Ensete ventricosum]|nr:hypothetical protein GW17_00011204 [Ensete ventricosum]RZS23451.1 hypothetical protein BHM03_00056388 [Ensete ventricosum]
MWLARRGALPTKALPVGTTPARPRGAARGQGSRWQCTMLSPAQGQRRRRNEGKGKGSGFLFGKWTFLPLEI